MITLTARIKLSSSQSSLDDGVGDFAKYANNISSKTIPKNKKVKGSKPFILGSSKLGEGATVSDKVDYVISQQLSNENGDFATPFEFTIKELSGVQVNFISIAFDTENNRHPKSIIVNGNEFFDDDAIFLVEPNWQSYQSTIKIENWNTPNAPLVITGIYLDISIDIDYKSLISLESSIFDRGDTKLPSYGIISNVGNLEFNDLNGEIRDYAEKLLLQSGLEVTINLKNNLSGKEKQVAKMETAQWDYDNDNRSVTVSLKDDLEEWQDIQVKGFNYDPRNPKLVLPNQDFADLYKWLQDPINTPTKYNMLPFDELDSQTQEILNQTYLPYPLLNDGTLWEQWTKICEVCGLYIYKNSEGKTVCSYTYGG